MSVMLGAVILAVAILALVLPLLLRRQLREKYAVIWLVIALAVLIVGAVPGLLDSLTRALGFQVPANLLFTVAILLLLAVTLHLSWEQSRAEEEIRHLAEEAAIANLEIDRLTRRLDALEARFAPADDDRSADS